ncbi:30S ribosomal protein S3 [Erysipelothrix rhusiopathiae]|uniref:30S ribosomal protein S3 n=1 Tax=Erysipelothrix rhusiopathiae TaxID=1648 RepID=UPI002B2459BC|nr:30S ribosomal protein S3 [Erysipelothrix rhusiopathiae]WRB93712.1 30S ribosomal protein S3 [Erysipelothrix rhusiopathiae]
MGQKVHPIGMRVGVIRDWESRWYAEKDFANLLHEDKLIRDYIFKNLKDAYVSRVEIERSKNRVDIIIRTVRPGVVIGVNGANIEKVKKDIAKISEGNTVNIKVLEVANPDLDAHLVARNIAEQLEQRASFRTAQKRTIQRTMRAGAKGIKTAVSGRLGGADMARSEGYSEGIVPLHTLRSDIDYAHYEANTQFGILGVKVWICRGEVLPGQKVQEPEAPKGGKFDRPRRRRNDRRPNNNPRNAKPAAFTASKDEQGGN